MNNCNWKIYCGSLLLIAVISCRQENVKSIFERCDKNEISSKHLISVTEAQNIFQQNNVILLEVSDPINYNKEHIPGAINIWRPDFRSKSVTSLKGMRCSQTELEELLSSFGTNAQSTLILYDNKGGVDAFRFKWVLDYYGFHNYKIINGGLTSWKKAGLKTTSDMSQIRPKSNFKLKGFQDSSILATMEEVIMAIDDTSTVILDTRELYEYLGEPFISKGKIYRHKKGAMIHGCIPSSVHLNWSDLSDLHDDHRIKCEKDLKFNLEQVGVLPGKKIIVYCQSGSRSSHTAYVLREILGYTNVKNYDGSWIEWSQAFVDNSSVNIEQKTDALKIESMIAQLEAQLLSLY